MRSGERLPYTLRIIFGANEETGMGDVPYYRRHFPDPAFLFTPDADFPVGYGEAGICHGRLVSAPIEGGCIRALAGGVANNAVPGEAFARLACPVDALPKAVDGVQVESDGGSAVVRAYGKSAHASEPESGDNAIDKLAAFLLGADVLSGEERAFLETVRKITAHTDGSGAGLQCSDDHFGGLTAVGSMIALEQAENGEGADCARMALTIDCRYPTTTSAEGIARIMNEAAAESGATYELLLDKPSYLVDPDSPAIRALVQAYCHATGEDARPVALKGGTYAREFPCAASFGPDKPWESLPAWAGGMHAADEAISEDALKQAFAIYVHAIGNLMQLDL